VTVAPIEIGEIHMLRTLVVLALLAVSFTAAATRIAHADDYDNFWNWNLHSGSSGHSHHRYYRPRARQTEVRYYRTPEVDRDDDMRGWECRDRVRGLGTQWIGTEGALEAAKKDWMERVRYDHGEKWIDMTNARSFESRCSRVSIGEVVGQVTYRCEIMARPCKPPFNVDQGALAKDKARTERQEDLRDQHDERYEKQRDR
jgi:hypothetical protein